LVLSTFAAMNTNSRPATFTRPFPSNAEIGRRMRIARKKRGWTIAQMAHLGIGGLPSAFGLPLRMPLMGLRLGWLRGGGGGGGISLMPSCYGWGVLPRLRGYKWHRAGIAISPIGGDYRFPHGSPMHATGMCSSCSCHFDLSICTLCGMA
jgi:hypothetical protein